MNYNIENIAEYIVTYSLKIKPYEKVFVNFLGYNNDFLDILYNCIKRHNAVPIVFSMTPNEEFDLIKNLNEENVTELTDKNLKLLSKCNYYISLLEDSDDINYEKYQSQYNLYRKKYKKIIRDYRLNHCKWIGLRLPSEKLANQFNMNYKEFEKFYYNVCGLDYNQLKEDYMWLRDLLSKTNHIEIIRDDTNLCFDKNNIAAQILCGEKNLPDGEIYTSPIKDSVNGTIIFNTVSKQNNYSFENIKLKFENGRIIDFDTNNNDLFNKIISIDDGSRYIGEFAIGINPMIEKPHGVILYDEKMKGSIHFALGQAYQDAYNGNDSSLHWDIVQVQKPNYGGGIILFDDEIIMKDGIIKNRKWRS